ncbi:glutamine-hydrolyzing carbamoyl-phosphate synthase small subunit [Longirhabdus pacifica]|uniref:glutamine-hydrolyzing carbamoyl-phosphate synthase small subunit n=1 Tax=Longirhabdus pacifica TaxID=2305227 RepID=UPI0010086F8E|nr:glutamine-hydrolyzing carbamoyl-phosphate synthase small subunit [Longirhabdus pacifica]
MQAKLLLEDGTLFTGQSFGSNIEMTGEVVFNTGMTGYQEILSDPSYCGQMVTMTYPLIGNYGMSLEDFEALKPHIHGFIVREHEQLPSNWRVDYSLDYCLKQFDIPGISGIDTRMLTRKIRQVGTMKAIITTEDYTQAELMKKLNGATFNTDQVLKVATKQTYIVPGMKERIVVMDFGVKSGIVRELVKRGCECIVVPPQTSAEEIATYKPDGILLSNGPGNPKDVMYGVETIKRLLGKYPLFGICMGHQLFALACGANTERLKFGHRGGNHPVKDIDKNSCYITSQNHGYTVTPDIPTEELEITHINNNDKTVEGLRHKVHPAFSVQYHPEAAPGPYDSSYLFDEFLTMVKQFQQAHNLTPRQKEIYTAASKGV